MLGASNPVAGPYFNFTLPEPTGVVAVVVPDEPTPDLERAAADSVKRVHHGAEGQSPWEIAAFLALKTVWHPIGV